MLANTFKKNRDILSALPLYERFEQAVCLVLTFLIALVIGVAVIHLAAKIIRLLLQDEIDPSNQMVFHTIFAMIMTVLIALEFKHSVLAVLKRHHNVVQVRTVVLIALLALVRKFIILDASKVDALTIIGLAGAALALGGVYWLVRDQDDRLEGVLDCTYCHRRQSALPSPAPSPARRQSRPDRAAGVAQQIKEA